MNDTGPMIDRLRAAGAACRALQGPIEAGRPWPLRSVEHNAPEAEWGPMEVLAHLTEMLPFWLGEVERILDGQPEPVPFGRTITDPVRAQTIERDRSLPPRELLDRIDAEVERYARRLVTLTPADLAREGAHPSGEIVSVEALLQRFVVGHTEGHVRQLTATLASPAQG